MPSGFHNHLLVIDLTLRQTETREPGETFFRTAFGGWAWSHTCSSSSAPAASPHFTRLPVRVRPPRRTLEPLHRVAVCARSPVTGSFGEDASRDFGAPNCSVPAGTVCSLRGGRRHPSIGRPERPQLVSK